jgi:alcohol dehydrogenase
MARGAVASARGSEMKAVLFEAFGEAPRVVTVDDPTPPDHGVVVKVEATGVCRSDWHGWMGHDPDIVLPHVPGHELAGVIVAVGKDVSRWTVGARVTVPFVGGCGHCQECHAGHQQVCENQFQPGFTHWGSFAEHVAIHRADLNIVALPESMDFTTAASLGCRFATAFRAVVDQGRVGAGQWVAVHGCGGVGLSAVMIANATGANVVAIDIAEDKLALARDLGAVVTINGRDVADVPEAVMEITKGGAHVSLDALGHPVTYFNSVQNLRRRGKHVQVGLMLADQAKPQVPMAKVIGWELELLGSHGMQAHRYGAMLDMVQSGKIDPARLVGMTISLAEAPAALMNMDKFHSVGATVLTGSSNGGRRRSPSNPWGGGATVGSPHDCSGRVGSLSDLVVEAPCRRILLFSNQSGGGGGGTKSSTAFVALRRLNSSPAQQPAIALSNSAPTSIIVSRESGGTNHPPIHKITR